MVTKTAKTTKFQIVELYYEPFHHDTLTLVQGVAYLVGKGFELVGQEDEYRFMDFGQHEAKYRRCFSFVSANKKKEFIKFYEMMDRAKIVWHEFDDKNNIVSQTQSDDDWAQYFWQHTDEDFASVANNDFKVKDAVLDLKWSHYGSYEISFKKSFKQINLVVG
jgi:hypothetical protein